MTFYSVAMSTMESAKKTIAMYLSAFGVAVMLMMVQGYYGFQVFRFEERVKPVPTTTQPETPIQPDKPVLPLREIDDLKATLLMSQRSIESLEGQVKNLTSQIASFTASTAAERAESRALIAEALKSNKSAEQNAELYAALIAATRWNSNLATDSKLGVQYNFAMSPEWATKYNLNPYAPDPRFLTGAIMLPNTYGYLHGAAGITPDENAATSAFEKPAMQNSKQK